MARYEISTPLLDTHNILGEGPVWHPIEQRLYWLDIDGCLLQTYTPETGSYQKYDLGQRCGAFAFRKTSGLLVAGERGLAYWDERSGLSEYLVRFYEDNAPQLMNDGKADPSGRFWIGSKGPVGQSSLFRVEPDYSWETVIPGATISNGLDWSLDQKSMFYIDSYTQSILKYRYNPASGMISDPEQIFRSDAGKPDGMTLDSEGNLWVAFWDGAKVLHLDPNGGLLNEISMPVSRPTSVCLGGADYRDLYISSASVGLEASQLEAQPYAGALFSFRVDVPGRPCNFFGG